MTLPNESNGYGNYGNGYLMITNLPDCIITTISRTKYFHLHLYCCITLKKKKKK